jgi:hypothetical protein
MMSGEHKILRAVPDGRVFFAKVGVESNPSSTWNVVWGADVCGTLPPLTLIYREAVERGVMLAASRQDDLGEASYEVKIVTVLWTISDTRADVLTCAAALAAWKSWGHLESDASLSFADDQWAISF